MKAKLHQYLLLLVGDERGAVAVATTASLVSLIGLSSLAIDYGYVRYVQTALQASADAAALAGATGINVNGSNSTATATAATYGSGTGGKNADAWLNSTVTTNATLKCLVRWLTKDILASDRRRPQMPLL